MIGMETTMRYTTTTVILRPSVPHLVRSAEDVRVVLLEPPDPDEPGERPGQLVAVEDAEVGQAQGELLPRADAVVEDEAVTYVEKEMKGTSDFTRF